MNNVFEVAVHALALLSETGSFFLQIGKENVHRLSTVLDEVFGASNRVATIAFSKTGGSSAAYLPEVADWLLWYAKDKAQVKYRQLYEPFSKKRDMLEFMSSYAMVEESDGKCRNLTQDERRDPDRHLPEGARLFKLSRLDSQGESKTGRSDPYVWRGISYPCPPGRHWSVSHDGLDAMTEQRRLIARDKGKLHWKWYEDEIPGRRVHNLWTETQSASDMRYVVETAEITIRRCLLMATDPGDLVLDPTCGSGTTAAVAEKWGRRWITIDASAIPVALCRQRILSAVHPWYLTRDDSEAQAEDAWLDGRADDVWKTSGFMRRGADPAAGFVYKRVPSVSPSQLAYGDQEEITYLVDRPIEKQGVKRISSPFTVESHSPWVYVSPSASETDERAAEREIGIRQNVVSTLEITGIASMDDRSDRQWFDGVELWGGGGYITHQATLRNGGDRVAIATIPDDQTAGAGVVDAAAREAASAGFRKLVVIAFNFEAGVVHEQRGILEVIPASANRDLTIGDLKSDKKDFAFVLVGEPNVELTKVSTDDASSEAWQVTVKGYHVYDPGTGNVRPGGKDEDIDCWMIDTDYDNKSFFVHRIHFPARSNDRQITRFKKALESRIDPRQWAFMDSLTSAPFRRPERWQGKRGWRIAVRIVTAFGDEMLTVLDVDEDE